MKSHDLHAYHKHLTDIYDKRSSNHDKSDWHRSTSLKLIDGLTPNVGDYILDVGTGTGTIAFHAASLIGPKGKVIGVDISEGMLEQARIKLSSSAFKNIEFQYADMEHLDFPQNTFDKIYCANAFFCILSPLQTLTHWRSLIKPGGAIAFHAIPTSSFFWVSVARDILAEHGFKYVLNTPTGTFETTERLLKEAGFSNIEIKVEVKGSYVPLENAKRSWIKRDEFAPGQYPHPVHAVPEDIYLKCQAEYETRIEKLATQDGVWNDVTMYYVYAAKDECA